MTFMTPYLIFMQLLLQMFVESIVRSAFVVKVVKVKALELLAQGHGVTIFDRRMKLPKSDRECLVAGCTCIHFGNYRAVVWRVDVGLLGLIAAVSPDRAQTHDVQHKR